MNWLLWALFGNDEDGYYGDLSFNPNKRTDLWTAIQWWFRNPFHNFSWRVIGVVGKPFERYGKYPKENFVPNWNWAVIKYKWLLLPFISYSGKLGHFYIGWRNNGSFGIKITGKLAVIFWSVILGIFILRSLGA